MKTLLYSIVFISLSLPVFAWAQSACGDFVVVEVYEGDVYEERTQIENCGNPFAIDLPAPFVPELMVNGNTVREGDTLPVSKGESVLIEGMVPEDSEFITPTFSLYVASGTDYYFVGKDHGGSSLNFSSALDEGVYVVVFSRSPKPVLVQDTSFLKQLFTFFLPNTAFAYHVDELDQITSLSFTVKHLPAPPVGASSILFLPGIMGSHLYEDNGECFGFGEQQRWFSHTDCEQLRLLTNPDGSSINDIYTKFEDGAIVDGVSVSGITLENLYTDFLARMNELDNSEVIEDFVPFPYDWRLRLDHIIRAIKDAESNEVRYVENTSLQDGLLYKTLSQMASSSHSGRVTIVSHSNGGLVAKAFLAELAKTNDPLEDKIDNLILIGSPQVGTPDAINGILHGTEIGPGGVVINQSTTRTILNTAPFGHHLLPNSSYFDLVQTPVINFKEGIATNALRNQFGSDITNFEQLKTFLDDSSGRVNPGVNDLKTPEVVEGTLLTYVDEIGNLLETWQVPDTLTIHQLGGSGIWTPSRIEYSSDDYCVRAVPVGFVCDMLMGRLDYEVHGTYDGDGTVVLPSALAMSESGKVNRRWLDLNDFNLDFELLNVHKNMLEVPEVATFIRDIVTGTTSPYAYISETPPPAPEGIRLMFHLHSPLDMYVTSDQGVVSSTTNEVSGAFYRRFGDVQYISLPNTVTNATLHLVGYDDGSFSLYKELWEGETEVASIDFKALPTNVGTVVTLPVNFDEDGLMQVDFDGDGMIDGTVSSTEDVIRAVVNPSIPTQPEVTEERNGNSGTRVARTPNGAVAGASTDSREEQLREIIRLLKYIIYLLEQETIV